MTCQPNLQQIIISFQLQNVSTASGHITNLQQMEQDCAILCKRQGITIVQILVSEVWSI